MDVRATTEAPPGTGADTIAVGALRGRGHRARHAGRRARGARRLRRGQARLPQARRHARRRQALADRRAGRARRVRPRARPRRRRRRGRPRPRARRALAVLGAPPPRLRRARRRAFVEGTRAGRLRLHDVQERAEDGPELAELIVSAHHDVSGPVESGRVVGESVNLARDLQNRPANDLTPTALAERAREIAGKHDTLTVEVDGPRGDRGGRHGRVRAASRRARRPSRADHAALRRRRCERPGARLSSARPSRSTPAASRSSPATRWRHEVRHVGRRRRAGGGGGDRAARAAGAPDRRDRRDREPAVRQRR